MSKIVVLACFLALVTPASAKEFPDWYGTITIDQTMEKKSLEQYPPGHSYGPGTRRVEEERTWSGTVTYLPGKRRVTSGSYFEHHLEDRKTVQNKMCLTGHTVEYHDFERSERTVRAGGTYELKNRNLSIYIGDDGAYRLNIALGLPSQKDGATYTSMREFFDGCQTNPLKRTDQSSITIGLASGITAETTANAGTLPPQTLEGETSLPETDGVKLTFSWKLIRAVPKVMALISAPAYFKRGDLVTLDATGSLGDLTEYTWRFSLGENCATAIPTDPNLELKGAKVSFHALCDFKANLYVKDSMGNGDRARTTLKVQAREGADWKTKYSSKAGKPLETRLMAEYLHFGANRCGKHEDEDKGGHMIHTTSENNATWLDDGYEVEQLSDNGPFSGMWWVKSQKLEIDRSERVNRNLLAGGELAALNQKHANLRDLQALAAQVQAHEQTHSALIAEALKQLGPDGDPAHQVEAVLGPNKEIIKVFADMKVREVETLLREATSEANVKARLQGQSTFGREASVWVPTTDSTEYLKKLGPLWSIGD